MAKGGPRVTERLTKRRVEAIPSPQRGSVYVGDAEVPGFCVRVHAGASRAWRAYVYRYTPRGGKGERYVTIGEHGCPWSPDPVTGRARTLTCELAREEALRLRGIRNAGGDPAAAFKAPQAPPSKPRCATLEDFAPVYFTRHADVHKSERSAEEDRGNWKRHLLAPLGKLPLDRIRYVDANDFHADLKATPVTANRCLSLLSIMLTVARQRGVLPLGWVNPCDDVRRFTEPKRERYLTPEELQKIGAALALEEAGGNVYGVAAVRVLAFTGARPTEVLTLRREQLRLDLGHVLVLRKGRWLPLYLPPPAIDVLRALPAKEGNPYVFPGRIVANHLTLGGIHTLWKRIATGITDSRPYDLRHTLASVAAQGGEGLPTIGAILGHTRAQTTARYAHLTDHGVRAAAAKASEEIAAALKGT